MKILKITLILLSLPILYVLGVLAWAYFSDFQPPEESEVYAFQNAEQAAPPRVGDTLTLLNWNIGFGGLGKEMDFFYDGGTQMRSPRELVQKNIDGIKQTLTQEYDAVFLQEIDLKAKRSYQINEPEAIDDNMEAYAQVFGLNYDVDFVPKPFLNPMGNVKGGILTLCRFPVASTQAYYYKNTYPLPDKLFYLDRCFTLARVALQNSDKQLVLINSHNSAYDPGGKMKKWELELMQKILLDEYGKGNYVVVGADWNMYPPGYKGVRGFLPKAEQAMSSALFPQAGWHWAWDSLTPTNRAVGEVHNPSRTYQSVIDYYLLSPNVKALEVRNLDNGFDFSDHQPVRIRLRLEE